MPSGTNYCIGFLSSEQTNEGYFAVYNSSNNHTIWVIRGDTGDVVKVHENTLLPFVLDPTHFLGEGRMTLELRSVIDPTNGAETNFKLLVFTNNRGFQGLIDVEASIATDSYTTTYFTTTAAHYNKLELINLGAATPLKCMGLNSAPFPYVPVPEDATKQNLLVNNGWQFRVRTWDIWGRPSSWGIISSVYTPLIGSGCIATSNGLPRCVNLIFDAGNPLVQFITIAYRRGVGNDPTGATETGWLEHETFRKYDDSTGVPWYERPYNPIFGATGSGIGAFVPSNLIIYTFCADKGSNPVDPTEASYTEPGIPRFSSSVGSVSKSLALANNVYGFQPIAQATIEAINFSVAPPVVAPCPAAPLRTIVFFACLYNPWHQSFPHLRKTFDIYTFGDGNNSTGPADTNCGVVTNFKVGQVFGDQNNPGFIAYLAGTPYKVISEWGDYDTATGIFTIVSPPYTGGTFPHSKMLRFTIPDVPAGKYSARLASHHATINDVDLQKTSTQVAGICAIQDVLTVGGVLNGYSSNPTKEIEVDCTSGNVNLGGLTDPMFAILDLNDENASNGIDGYLYEQSGGLPVEMAVCDIFGTQIGLRIDGYGSYFTDHNGYYFMATGASDQANINIYADLCTFGGFGLIYSQTSGCGGTNGKMMHGDGQPPRNPDYWGNNGNWKNQVYIAGPTKTLTTFPDLGRRPVRQVITSCDAPTIGIPGIPVVLTKCQPGLTDGDGAVMLFAHNRYNYSPAFGSDPPPGSANIPLYATSPFNEDLVIYSQRGGCQWNECGTCNTSIADATVAYVDCTGVYGSGCASVGQIREAEIYPPSPGIGYVVGDTADVNMGTLAATIEITGITTGGAVAYFIVTFHGEGFAENTVFTTTATSGIGTGLQILVVTVFPPPRTVCLSPISLSANGVGIKGLQAGAKYPVAFWLHDVIGHHTAPQVKMGELGYVTVPNLNDNNPAPYPSMSLCGLTVTIPSSLTVDTVFTKMTFLVGPNVLFRDFFSWSADWVQYVDNTGATNTTNPTAIRIYFQSLNEYNKQYNLRTNVAWDFIDLANSDGGVNDIVQFIMNGDGTWLPPVKGAAVTYDKHGSFFTIAYQSELANLQNGCLFKIIRPKQNTTGTTLPYYEQCLTLNITNGLLPAGTYTIPYQDSYLLSRSIPVPLLKGQSGPITPGGIATGIQYTSVNQDAALATSGYSQNNINNNNGVVIWQAIDAQTTFPFFFESPSPSDLWGSHLSSQGRVGIPNPYEKQFRIGTEIAVSNPIADKGIVNGMGTFLSSNKEVFDRNTWGDITAILVETSVILVICDRDHFVVRFNGSTVRVDGQGNLIAQNQQGIFTSPERKAGTNYGCGMMQINTIQKFAGIVRWVDNTGYVVIHNFSTADSNTDDAGYLGYFLNLLGEINIANSNPDLGVTYLAAGIDTKTSEYYLTKFTIPFIGSTSYINTDSQPSLDSNVTFIFDLRSSILKGFASYTPEFYGRIPGFYSQRQFLTFKGGAPYIHHWGPASGASQPLYCNFYGTQCEVRITHIINGVDGKLLPDKVKRFLWTEVYTKQNVASTASPPTMPEALFYADNIVSEKGQVSRLLVPRFTLRDGYQTAAYLCNLNTPSDINIPIQTGAHAILDGDALQGRWLQVSFVSQSGWNGKYFEVSEIVSYVNFIEKTAD